MAKLTISGVLDNVVFKWLLFFLLQEKIRVKEMGGNNNTIELYFQNQDEAYYTFNHLVEKTQEAEADYKLELTSY